MTNLERGEYTVTENVNSSYTLKEATVGTETNCRSNISQAKEITFNIGTDKDGKEVLKDGNTDTTNGGIGVAKFTNEKSVADVEFEKVDKVDETKIKVPSLLYTKQTKQPGTKFLTLLLKAMIQSLPEIMENSNCRIFRLVNICYMKSKQQPVIFVRQNHGKLQLEMAER